MTKLYGCFTDSPAYLENLFVAVGNAEPSNKMASYSTDQKVFVIKAFYPSGCSSVAAEEQYRREFSVKRVSWLIFGFPVTYSYRDTIQTETGAAKLKTSEQHCHMEIMIEIWCELRYKMKDSISLIYSVMKANFVFTGYTYIYIDVRLFACVSVFTDVKPIYIISIHCYCCHLVVLRENNDVSVGHATSIFSV